MQIIKRGMPYYGKLGGVSFSGGEPLLQADFVRSVLQECKLLNIHTTIDSSLYIAPSELEKVTPFTDLVLADIKSINMDTSSKLTGRPNQANFDNLVLLKQLQIKVWIRYVVVPGWTDNPDDIKKMAFFITDIPNVEKIELLSYHTLGKHEWNMLGLAYELEGIVPPSHEYLKELAGQIAALSGKLTVF